MARRSEVRSGQIPPANQSAQEPMVAAADSARQRAVHPLGQSAELATMRTRRIQPRTPRSRPMKRALECRRTSALAVHACRARGALRAGRKTLARTLGGRLKNDCAPGQRARSAQSTSLLKPTAQFAACCPNATRFEEFLHQTLRIRRVIRIIRLPRRNRRGCLGRCPRDYWALPGTLRFRPDHGPLPRQFVDIPKPPD